MRCQGPWTPTVAMVPLDWPLRSFSNHVEDRPKVNKDGVEKNRKFQKVTKDGGLKEGSGNVFGK